MSVVAVVPLRGRDGKSRLAGALPQPARAALVAELARHVTGVLAAAPGVDRVVVVSAAPDAARSLLGGVVDPADVLAQPPSRSGLDGAVLVGRDAAAGADRVAVVHADLPALTTDDVGALLARPEPVVLAPDDAGTGTNALVLRVPAAAGYRTAFGPGSAAAHRAEAARLGLAVGVVRRPGLAVDLDVAADWRHLPDAVRAALLRRVPGVEVLDGTDAGVRPTDVTSGPGAPPRRAASAAG